MNRYFHYDLFLEKGDKYLFIINFAMLLLLFSLSSIGVYAYGLIGSVMAMIVVLGISIFLHITFIKSIIVKKERNLKYIKGLK